MFDKFFNKYLDLIEVKKLEIDKTNNEITKSMDLNYNKIFQVNDMDNKLKILDSLEKDPVDPFFKNFTKPALDNTWINYYMDKLKDLEIKDLEEFIIEYFKDGETQENDLKSKFLIEKYFPSILDEKLIKPLTKLDLHEKYAKICIRGPKEESDFVLLFLALNKQIKFDDEMVALIIASFTGYKINPDEIGRDGIAIAYGDSIYHYIQRKNAWRKYFVHDKYPQFLENFKNSLFSS